jgi:hypothetical protein
LTPTARFESRKQKRFHLSRGKKRAALIDRKATMPAGDMPAPCLRW